VMHRAVMDSAERNRKFVADLASHSPRLGETKVVQIGWLPPADKARLGRYEYLSRSLLGSPNARRLLSI
jgi:hypothetical protein